jgi:hypothetical protein
MIISFFFEPLAGVVSAFGSTFILEFAFKMLLNCLVDRARHYGIIGNK